MAKRRMTFKSLRQGQTVYVPYRDFVFGDVEWKVRQMFVANPAVLHLAKCRLRFRLCGPFYTRRQANTWVNMHG